MRYSARSRYEKHGRHSDAAEFKLPELNFSNESPEIKKLQLQIEKEMMRTQDFDYEVKLMKKKKMYKNPNMRNLVESEMRLASMNYLQQVDQ